MTAANIILALAAARAAAATVQGTGSGTDVDPCVTTNCNGPGTECTYTATVDPFDGYFKFAECGDVAHPVIVMKRGVTYTFDQSDDSNWYHPLGFAYVVDGAKKGDELEPGITQTGDACAGMNTCQAPMYYKNGVFAGAAGYDNTLQWPTGGTDFGLDAYEPDFSIRKEDWLATKYTVKLTLTDTTYATDIFYFCHIHGGMSGYIKIADASGTVVSTTGTGDALIPAGYYGTPSTYEGEDAGGGDGGDDSDDNSLAVILGVVGAVLVGGLVICALVIRARQAAKSRELTEPAPPLAPIKAPETMSEEVPPSTAFAAEEAPAAEGRTAETMAEEEATQQSWRGEATETMAAEPPPPPAVEAYAPEAELEPEC